MKKLYATLVFLLVLFSTQAQIVNIPDANFKAKLLEADFDNDIAGHLKIDINDDGQIQESEALNVFILDVSYSFIQDMTGIEAFLNLIRLNCFTNQLTSIDVTQNIALTYLSLNENSITNLDVTQNLALEYLLCNQNQLTNLDVTQNTALTYLSLYENQLTNLDVTQNLALEYLLCHQNQLTSLDVTQNIALEILGCSINQITDLDVTQNIALTNLDCDNNQLTSLDVTQNIALTTLNCAANQLTSLDVTQNVDLQFLYCTNNQLISLDVTQNVDLEYLNCMNNQLTDLDFSQNIALTNLNCMNNQLTDLDFSQNIALTNLNCDNNQLISLDVTQNGDLEYLYCINNQLTSLDVTQNINLVFLFCYYNQLTSLDVTQNLKLEMLGCAANQLTSLDVNQNNWLTDLYCNDNQLISLYIKNNNQYWNDLYFEENPNLEYVCANENDLAIVQQKIIDYGYTNCNANTYCSFVPGGLFYTLQGNTKYDNNNNGCDDLDLNYSNLNFTISNGSVSGSLIANTSGYYSIPVQSGSYTINPVLENPNYFIISPTSATIDFLSETSPLTQNFCATANGNHQDLEVVIVPTSPARPGFVATYTIMYKNKGNQTTSGYVSLNYSANQNVMSLNLATPNVSTSNNSILTWDYYDLQPLETRIILLSMTLNTPMQTPPLNAGDDLGLATIIYPLENDEFPSDNRSDLKQVVVNSYDPNDKTCIQGTTITPNMVGQYVHYVIRFENTGTFPAENVVVTDVIDATKFDVSTLIPQTSSHSFVTRINNGKVEFIFENINLPFDDANNDGYVAFKIKTKPTLVLGDTFTNNASIYFDYNFPIITNTTATTVTALSTQDFEFNTYFTIYPNPAKQTLNINSKNEIGVKSVAIYNTLGQVVLAFTNAETLSSLDVSQLKTGAYFIRLTTDKGTASQQFLKE